MTWLTRDQVEMSFGSRFKWHRTTASRITLSELVEAAHGILKEQADRRKSSEEELTGLVAEESTLEAGIGEIRTQLEKAKTNLKKDMSIEQDTVEQWLRGEKVPGPEVVKILEKILLKGKPAEVIKAFLEAAARDRKADEEKNEEKKAEKIAERVVNTANKKEGIFATILKARMEKAGICDWGGFVTVFNEELQSAMETGAVSSGSLKVYQKALEKQGEQISALKEKIRQAQQAISTGEGHNFYCVSAEGSHTVDAYLIKDNPQNRSVLGLEQAVLLIENGFFLPDPKLYTLLMKALVKAIPVTNEDAAVRDLNAAWEWQKNASQTTFREEAVAVQISALVDAVPAPSAETPAPSVPPVAAAPSPVVALAAPAPVVAPATAPAAVVAPAPVAASAVPEIRRISDEEIRTLPALKEYARRHTELFHMLGMEAPESGQAGDTPVPGLEHLADALEVKIALLSPLVPFSFQKDSGMGDDLINVLSGVVNDTENFRTACTDYEKARKDVASALEGVSDTGHATAREVFSGIVRDRNQARTRALEEAARIAEKARATASGQSVKGSGVVLVPPAEDQDREGKYAPPVTGTFGPETPDWPEIKFRPAGTTDGIVQQYCALLAAIHALIPEDKRPVGLTYGSTEFISTGLQGDLQSATEDLAKDPEAQTAVSQMLLWLAGMKRNQLSAAVSQGKLTKGNMDAVSADLSRNLAGAKAEDRVWIVLGWLCVGARGFSCPDRYKKNPMSAVVPDAAGTARLATATA
ncbi:MAG: hypothetical protein M3O22_07930 [Pseudomonadota bacterium]|nr:hypothetical protein [Pseudomonadota bacterium]